MKIQMPIMFAAATLLGACTLEELGTFEQLGSLDQPSPSDPSPPPDQSPPTDDQQPTPPPPSQSEPQVPKPPQFIPLCEITWDTFQGKYVDTGTCLMVSTAVAPNTCTHQVLVNWQCQVGAADRPHTQCSNDVPKSVGVNLCYMGVEPNPLPAPEIPGGPVPRPDIEEPSDEPTHPGV